MAERVGGAAADKRAAWLSQSFTTFIEKNGNEIFDVLIVGSGYGGAIAAAELSNCTSGAAALKICVLERGKEYLGGMFPTRMSDLPGHLRFAQPNVKRQSGVLDGLYDVRFGEDAVVVVASGLGGGSLINAGVMEMPLESVFKEAGWPRGIQKSAGAILSLAEKVQPVLGAMPFARPGNKPLPKTSVLKQLDPASFKKAQITVAGHGGSNIAGITLDECKLCGDCASGCNYNAKNSLDLNLLSLAKDRQVKIVTGATVLRIRPRRKNGGDWAVVVNHTDAHMRIRQRKPFVIRAKKVILAAGTLGSTEILKRSHDKERFPISAQLGRRFSANGDMIAVGYGLKKAVNAVADEATDPCEKENGRGVGPTITGMLDLRTGNPDTDVVIQDLAVPGPLRRLFEESVTTFDSINKLVSGDWSTHSHRQSQPDTASVDRGAIQESLVVAMIGRDSADGELVMSGDCTDHADGMLTVHWPELKRDCRFQTHHKTLAGLVRAHGGRLVKNLFTRPLSDDLERLLGVHKGPSVTVHPLGGCAMGTNFRDGVTDQWGQVFIAREPDENDEQGRAPTTYEGLAVLDGSIIPTSLGINPSLTIATLAFRALGQLKRNWQFQGASLIDSEVDDSQEAKRRPLFACPTINTDPVKTKIELTEQVRGCITLRDASGHLNTHEVELTLTTEPVEIEALTALHTSRSKRGMVIAPAQAGRPGKGVCEYFAPDVHLILSQTM